MKEEGTACTHILQRESENMQRAGGLMHKSWEQQLLGLHTERDRERESQAQVGQNWLPVALFGICSKLIFQSMCVVQGSRVPVHSSKGCSACFLLLLSVCACVSFVHSKKGSQLCTVCSALVGNGNGNSISSQ